jgi:hypothetical protein
MSILDETNVKPKHSKNKTKSQSPEMLNETSK